MRELSITQKGNEFSSFLDRVGLVLLLTGSVCLLPFDEKVNTVTPPPR